MIDCKNGSRVLPFCPFTFCDAQQGTMLLQKNASMCFRHRRQYAAWRKTLRATAAPRRWKKVREILYKCIIIFYSNLRCAISTLDQVITLYLSIRDCYYTAAIACRGRLGYADTCEFKLSCWLRNDVCAGQESGAHWILPPNSKKPFEAWCDNEFEDGGWMIVVKIARDQSRDQPLWYATTSACVCYFALYPTPFPPRTSPFSRKSSHLPLPPPPFFSRASSPAPASSPSKHFKFAWRNLNLCLGQAAAYCF